jgi:hypothetical protein
LFEDEDGVADPALTEARRERALELLSQVRALAYLTISTRRCRPACATCWGSTRR